jgi:hypothetical protein
MACTGDAQRGAREKHDEVAAFNPGAGRQPDQLIQLT